MARNARVVETLNPLVDPPAATVETPLQMRSSQLPCEQGTAKGTYVGRVMVVTPVEMSVAEASRTVPERKVTNPVLYSTETTTPLQQIRVSNAREQRCGRCRRT